MIAKLIYCASQWRIREARGWARPQRAAWQRPIFRLDEHDDGRETL